MSPELARILNEAPGPGANEHDAIVASIKDAYDIVQKYIPASPLRWSPWLSEHVGGDVYLKLECLNPKGSFKIRGALTAISRRMMARGVSDSLKICAASAGNHAQGIALAAKLLGCEAHIFLPTRTPLVKRQSTEQLGARVYMRGDSLEEATEHALAFARAEDAEIIHAFNDFDIISGQGTCGLESVQQFKNEFGDVSKIDTFVYSIGGGGLAAGSGYIVKDMSRAKVIGVEQKNFDSAYMSIENRQITRASKPELGSIADGIAVRLIGNLTYEYLKEVVDRIVLVADDHIVSAVLGLCEHERIVAEGAGAAGVAALLKNPDFYEKKTTIVCVSGGNIDPQMMTRVISRGLNVTGRVLKIRARIGDRPGHLAHLLEVIGKLEVNVLEVYHDRTYSQVNVGDVGVELALETKNFEHQYELIERLEELGYEPKIPRP